MGRTQPIHTQRRAEALAIAEQHGAAEASRRTGIPQTTIRSWKHRAEQAASPEVDDVERLDRLAQDARRTAERALAKANEAIAAGRGTDARNLMVAHGIAVEKHGLLAQQAQAAREHEARISEQQGKTIAALIRALMESCGLPIGTPGVGEVIRELLGQCRKGEPSPLSAAKAEKARAEIRAAVLPESKSEGLVEARPELPAGEDDRSRGLLAPRQTTHEANEGTGMFPDVSKGVAFH